MSSYEVGNVGGRLDRQTVSVITTTGIPLSQSCTMSSPPAQAPTSKANLKKKKKNLYSCDSGSKEEKNK